MTKVRILLVDDETPFLQTLAELLQTTLLTTVYTATSVPDALSQIDRNGPFDILISDYQMPPHTAHDLAQHLRDAKNKIPLILHSGFSDIDESHFEGAPYLGFVPKPDHRQLIRLILDHFPHAKKP